MFYFIFYFIFEYGEKEYEDYKIVKIISKGRLGEGKT